MTKKKQIEANRRNARHSTGPITADGKQRSRRNAVRHGLSAETVICARVHAEDYAGLDAAIIADYDAQRLRLANCCGEFAAPPPCHQGNSSQRHFHLHGKVFIVTGPCGTVLPGNMVWQYAGTDTVPVNWLSCPESPYHPAIDDYQSAGEMRLLEISDCSVSESRIGPGCAV